MPGRALGNFAGYLPVCLSVCGVCLWCLSVFLSACLPVSACASVCVCLPVCLSVCPSLFRVCVCLCILQKPVPCHIVSFTGLITPHSLLTEATAARMLTWMSGGLRLSGWSRSSASHWRVSVTRGGGGEGLPIAVELRGRVYLPRLPRWLPAVEMNDPFRSWESMYQM